LESLNTLAKNWGSDDKHITSLTISGDSSSELKDNAFSGFTFDSIDLMSCGNLSKISQHAFNGTDHKTSSLEFSGLPRLKQSSSLFAIINKMTNLTFLGFFETNVTEIPSHAFSNNLARLSDIRFMNQVISKINSYAFSNLSALNSIEISDSKLDYAEFAENAFALDKPIEHHDEKFRFGFFIKFNIQIVSNHLIPDKLNSSIFKKGAFSGTKLPATIWMDGSIINSTLDYLAEDVFYRFLQENPKNTIQLKFLEIDCNDCRNAWIRNKADARNRVKNFFCKNGTHIEQLDKC
jgi:hypothetical protein